MALAEKLAQLVRKVLWPGLGRRAAGLVARVRRTTPRVGIVLLGTTLVLGGFLADLAFGSSSPHATPGRHTQAPARHREPAAVLMKLGNRIELLGAKAVDLPAATAAPVAAPAALVSAPPLAGRENFAFAPYWTLAQSGSFSLVGLSTLAYFSIGVNADGTLDRSGAGWNGYQSQALTDLITRAHAAGERVVLTVNDFDQGSLDSLTASPAAPSTLATALIPLLRAKSLDGVNFDLEGAGSKDQTGLTNLIASVSGALRAADPHWQITMDTYASSAGDPTGFYNIPALAPSVDAFFVMAYELNLEAAPTAGSPLTSTMFSDLTTLQQYTAVVPPGKVLLGTPFFGIDWPTSNGTLQAQATGGAADIAVAQVQGSDEPQYWDPITETGWTSYQVGSQWHESYFENLYGLHAVAQLVSHFGVRGVGIWALGMEDNGAQMILAMDGFGPAGGPGGTGPTSTSESPGAPSGAPGATASSNGSTTTTSTTRPAASTTTSTTRPTAGTTSTTRPTASTTTSTTRPAPSTTTTTAPAITATYAGAVKSLTPVGPGGVDTLNPAGSVTNFQSTNPAYACLDGKSLAVYDYGILSGKYVAVAQAPTDCLTQEFTFPQ
ncbi:MAG TPA: glycosyl hydrolase family 18 protein [Acidimicrobiales bacterium]|nr:glycosyl hydrolase family 18 protein [Acidimicrobiales bacterium]